MLGYCSDMSQVDYNLDLTEDVRSGSSLEHSLLFGKLSTSDQNYLGHVWIFRIFKLRLKIIIKYRI